MYVCQNVEVRECAGKHCLMEFARGVVQWNPKPAQANRLKENAHRNPATRRGFSNLYICHYYSDFLKDTSIMDLLMKCAVNYQALINYEYHFTLGRKGKLHKIVLGFSKTDFHHLAGLHKLKDLHIARANRNTVFHQTLHGKITYNTLTKSQFFPQIQERVNTLPYLESFLASLFYS